MNRLINQVKMWAEGEKDIWAVVLVGSYARGTQHRYSDVDFCIVTDKKEERIRHPEFCRCFGEIEKSRTEYYGACTSIRVWYENGIEAEFGMVAPTWMAHPLEKGTLRVLQDGYKLLVDKKGLFSQPGSTYTG